MPSSRETNTMAEGCQRILQEITKMEIMPDADMAFLGPLHDAVVSYLKAPTPEPTTMTGAPADPLAGAMGQVMQPPASMGAPMGGPGPMPMGATNPDEMRRMLAGNQ